MKILAIIAILLVGSQAHAIKNFQCLLSLAQQVDPVHHKAAYTVEGEQNPPLVEYDYNGPEEQIHYYKVIATGNYIHELEETFIPSEAIMVLKFQRVRPDEPTMPDLPDGVRVIMDSTYGFLRAGLGMRDNYNTYAQMITVKLHNGKLGVVMLNCLR